MIVCVVLLMSAAFVTAENGPAPWKTLNDGHKYPAIGLGTWLGRTKSGGRVEAKGDEVRQAVEWAIDAGYRQIDTAYIYNTEEQVGRAVYNKISQGVVKRENLFITTKLWNDKHDKGVVVPDLRTSLEKLNMSYVDLYLMHWPIALNSDGSIAQTDYVETWRGMIEARDQGLTKSIGVSNFNISQLNRLMSLTTTKPSVLQVEHELGVVPIPKSLAKKHIEQNLNIFDFSLTKKERDMMKAYDKNYRTTPRKQWIESPYYPFEKKY